MKEQLLKNYLETPFKIQPFLKRKNIINIDFKNGPFVEVIGAFKEDYEIINIYIENSKKILNGAFQTNLIPNKIKIRWNLMIFSILHKAQDFMFQISIYNQYRMSNYTLKLRSNTRTRKKPNQTKLNIIFRKAKH